MASDTEERALRLDDETIKVIRLVMFELHPPINPAVLLLAMRNWYLEYGTGPVLSAMSDWLGQVLGYNDQSHTDTLTQYHRGQAEFTEKTGLGRSESNGS